MKLLLDENLSRRIVPFLQSVYPGSSHVVLVDLHQSDDQAIREYAREHGFVIVTHDADFYEMSLLDGNPPKIIWLKTGNQSKGATINLLLQQHSFIGQTLITENKACVEIYSTHN